MTTALTSSFSTKFLNNQTMRRGNKFPSSLYSSSSKHIVSPPRFIKLSMDYFAQMNLKGILQFTYL